MDELGRKIIQHLQKDGRAKNSDIARRLGVSEGTVRRRIKSLVDSGTVRIVAIPNLEKMGYETLEWSAQMNENTTTASKDKNIYLDFFLNLISVVFAIALFFLLPLVFTFYFKTTINQPFIFNIISNIV